jgi:cytochrome c oxidase cbb3-type subunit II
VKEELSKMAKFDHGKFERNPLLFLIGMLVVIAIGGLVEITPLFFVKSTIEEVDGMRPYTPLELEGRQIFVREGCYLCHSQMIRSLRSEVERYGHYSLAAESMYDHPFQWGSRRTGPDLARVGGKYSDEWHRIHMAAPRDVVPESIMPGYPFLARRQLNPIEIRQRLRANQIVGVPYSDEMVASAVEDFQAQATPDGDTAGLEERYPGVLIRDFDGNPELITELDALVAYLQMLGTLVDFDLYKADENDNNR